MWMVSVKDGCKRETATLRNLQVRLRRDVAKLIEIGTKPASPINHNHSNGHQQPQKLGWPKALLRHLARRRAVIGGNLDWAGSKRAGCGGTSPSFAGSLEQRHSLSVVPAPLAAQNRRAGRRLRSANAGFRPSPSTQRPAARQQQQRQQQQLRLREGAVVLPADCGA